MFRYCYQTFIITGSPTAFQKKFASILESRGLKYRGSAQGRIIFINPSLLFTSKRPISYVSRISVEPLRENGSNVVLIGASFARLKLAVSLLILIVCFIIPVMIGFASLGRYDLPPTSWIGIPFGYLLYLHLRARANRSLRKLVNQSGEAS